MKLKLAAFLSFVVLLIVANNLNFNSKHYEGLLEADARGYYAYLPAVFIYQDVQFSFFDSVENGGQYNQHYAYDYRYKTQSGTVNKYYLGTAILQLPFFGLGHAFATLAGDSTDGYSFWYFVWIQIGAILYGAIGLYLLLKVLRLELTELQSIILGVATVFGTNLFYYLVVEPGMSHVYTFFLVSLLLYLVASNSSFTSIKFAVQLGVLMGLITLIRPINGVLVGLCLLPFLVLKYKLLQNLKALKFIGLAMVIAGLLFSAQLLWYKVATGFWWVYSYGEEGFNWLDPHGLDFLFSYKKGVLLYTPFYAVAFLGAYGSTRKKDKLRLALFAALVVVVYVLASWWSWWYGGSFSQRVAIDFLPFVVWLAVPFVQQIQLKWQKATALIVLIIVVLFCQFQTYQYRYFLIHWEQTTAEMYWQNFLVLP